MKKGLPANIKEKRERQTDNNYLNRRAEMKLRDFITIVMYLLDNHLILQLQLSCLFSA